MGKKIKKKFKVRHGIQIFFFALIGLISVNHTLVESGKALWFISDASLHSICPLGGVVSIYQYITTGTFVKKIHESSVILMGAVFFLSIIFGPVFCGWICPLGTVQEWFSKLGKKIFKTNFNHWLPEKMDTYLRYMRYGVLIWVIYVTIYSGQLLFEAVDPYYALFNFWTDEVALGGLIVLGITLISSLFIHRPWCKYACPYGAILGLTNLFRIFKVRRNVTTCVACSICDNVCPMNINISNKEVIKNHQCISCLECTSEASCPIEETVEFSTKGIGEKEVKVHEN